VYDVSSNVQRTSILFQHLPFSPRMGKFQSFCSIYSRYVIFLFVCEFELNNNTNITSNECFKVRMIKLVIAACFFIGRLDTPFLAEKVGRLHNFELDNYPTIFLKDLLQHEGRSGCDDAKGFQQIALRWFVLNVCCSHLFLCDASFIKPIDIHTSSFSVSCTS
jgi:hypothetical protein